MQVGSRVMVGIVGCVHSIYLYIGISADTADFHIGRSLTLSPVQGGHIVPPPVVLYYLKIEGHILG